MLVILAGVAAAIALSFMRENLRPETAKRLGRVQTATPSLAAQSAPSHPGVSPLVASDRWESARMAGNGHAEKDYGSLRRGPVNQSRSDASAAAPDSGEQPVARLMDRLVTRNRDRA